MNNEIQVHWLTPPPTSLLFATNPSPPFYKLQTCNTHIGWRWYSMFILHCTHKFFSLSVEHWNIFQYFFFTLEILAFQIIILIKHWTFLSIKFVNAIFWWSWSNAQWIVNETTREFKTATFLLNTFSVDIFRPERFETFFFSSLSFSVGRKMVQIGANAYMGGGKKRHS